MRSWHRGNEVEQWQMECLRYSSCMGGVAVHEMGFKQKRRSQQVKCVLSAAVMVGLGPEMPGRS